MTDDLGRVRKGENLIKKELYIILKELIKFSISKEYLLEM